MSQTLVQSARKRRVLRRVGAGAVVPLIGSSLVFLGGPASAAITPTANAGTIAGAVAAPGTFVDGAAFVSVAGSRANGVADSTLAGFPTNGPDFGILTSGAG